MSSRMNGTKRSACIAGVLVILLFLALRGIKQPAGEWKFPVPENEMAHYTAYHVSEPILIDGKPNEKCWQMAPRSTRFVDLISGKRTRHDTYAAILWDETNVYVAYWVEEPFLEASFTNNNAPIYYDNDVECFIAGNNSYYEFEINGFNTTYEVFFIWKDAYERAGYSADPLFAREKMVNFNGVGYHHHPRGLRLGNFSWHFPGKQTAVSLDGTVNDDSDHDRGWTVELAFPWKGMEALAKSEHRSLPPKDGDVWRIALSRFNKLKEPPPAHDSGGWFWNRHGAYDSHIPELFPFITFSTNDVSTAVKSK